MDDQLPDTLLMKLARSAQRRLRGAFSIVVDRYLGVATEERRVAGQLGFDTGARIAIRPLGWTACWRVLRRLSSSTSGGAFLDLGCGSGRMVCAAARYGYSRAIGVEILPAIARLAMRNVNQLREPHAPCLIVDGDATQYEVPDDVAVVFLYNPFRGETLAAAVSQIIRSVDRVPRDLIVAYANPFDHQRMLATRRLRPIERWQLSWRPTRDWNRSQAVQFYRVTSSKAEGQRPEQFSPTNAARRTSPSSTPSTAHHHE